jgi:hypothetical protein
VEGVQNSKLIFIFKEESSNSCFIENISVCVCVAHNIPQLVQDEGCPVKFYDWKTFLKQFFKPLSSLTTYHHLTLCTGLLSDMSCTPFEYGMYFWVQNSKLIFIFKEESSNSC